MPVANPTAPVTPAGSTNTNPSGCHSPAEAAQGLLEIARTAKRDADRTAAWREILDRGWGKAPAFASIEGADPLEHDEVAQEIRAIAEALARERDAG